MKKLIYSILLLTTATVLSQGSQNSDPVKDGTNEAEKFYSNRVIVGFDKNIAAKDLLGSIIYFKESDKENWEFFSLLKKEEIEKIDPNFKNEVIFQKIVDQQFVTDANYLGFIKGSVTVNNRLEIILEDIFDLTAPTFIDDPNILSLLDNYGKYYKRNGYKVMYVDKVNLATLTSRLFKENSQSIGITYIDANGKRYKKETDFTIKKILSVHAIDVTPYIDLKNSKGLFENSMENGIIKADTLKSIETLNFIPNLKMTSKFE